MVCKTQKEMLGTCLCGPWVIELAHVLDMLYGPREPRGPLGPAVDVKT